MKTYQVTYQGGEYTITAASDLDAILLVPSNIAMFAAWSIEVTEIKPEVKEPSIKIRALKLAHAIKQAYTSFSSALRVAYRVLKCTNAKRQIMRGLSNAAHLCSKLGLRDKSYALATAYSVLFCLPKLPALRGVK